FLFFRRRFRRFELGGDQGVVLGAEVDLLREVAGARPVPGLLVADELVLALELLDVPDADLELVGDPRVGTALPRPGADLVEMGAQGFPGHGRSGRLAQSGVLSAGPGGQNLPAACGHRVASCKRGIAFPRSWDYAWTHRRGGDAPVASRQRGRCAPYAGPDA